MNVVFFCTLLSCVLVFYFFQTSLFSKLLVLVYSNYYSRDNFTIFLDNLKVHCTISLWLVNTQKTPSFMGALRIILKLHARVPLTKFTELFLICSVSFYSVESQRTTCLQIHGSNSFFIFCSSGCWESAWNCLNSNKSSMVLSISDVSLLWPNSSKFLKIKK